MTKKHFEEFAKEIKWKRDRINNNLDLDPNEKIEILTSTHYAVNLVTKVAKKFNPNFDKNRFCKACGLDN